MTVSYIKLENIYGQFRKPCVVDIKMGKKTYDPEAGPAKIAKEMTKFPYVEKFGFQFTGMQVYDPVDQRTNFYDKFFCRKIGENELLRKGLGTFFNLKRCLRRDAIQAILEKLRTIEKWFLSQRLFSFYASSLLVVYEGDTTPDDNISSCNCCVRADSGCSISNSIESEEESSFSLKDSTEFDQLDNAKIRSKSDNSDEVDSQRTSSDSYGKDSGTAESINADSEGSVKADSEDSISKRTELSSENVSLDNVNVVLRSPQHKPVIADVRMIDFTHVFSTGDRDDNYLYGLQNLIRNLELLLELQV